MTGPGERGDEELGKRVIAARGRSVIEPESVVSPQRGKSKISWATVTIIALAAVVTLFALRRTASTPPVSGALEADERTEVVLAHRGRAVLEPGAAIDWTVEANGGLVVGHHRGTVFYRTRGGSSCVVVGGFGRLEARAGRASFTVSVAAVTVHQGRLELVCGALSARFEAGPARDLPVCTEAD